MSSYRSNAHVDPSLIAPASGGPLSVSIGEQQEIFQIGTSVVRVFTKEPNRIEYVIQNQDGGIVYYGTNPNLTIANGVPLLPRRKYKSHAQGELYMISEVPAGLSVLVAWEFRI